MLATAIYCRVSTQEQSAHGYSLAAQENDCRRLAGEIGASVISVFRDADSGVSWNLPGLNALLDAASRNDFELVLCYDPDRLARRAAKQLVIEEELKRFGIAVRYVTLLLEGKTEDWLLRHLRSSIAEYERIKIAIRTSRGRRAKAERGIVVGSGVPPYGYRYTHNTDGRVHGMEPDPVTAPVVQRIFRQVATMSVNRVCDGLNTDGIPTYLGGAKWVNATTLQMLKNPVYLGAAAYGRRDAAKRQRQPEQWLSCAVPAIVSAEVARAAQEGLASRRGRGGVRSSGPDPYLLRGLLTCGCCDGWLSAYPVRSPQGRIYRYYVCLRHQPSRRERSKDARPCTLPPVAAEALEQWIWERVEPMLLDRDALDHRLSAIRDQRLGSDARRSERLTTLDNEIDRLRHRIRRIHSERVELEPDSESGRAMKALVREAEVAVAHLLAAKLDLQVVPASGLDDTELASLQRLAVEMSMGSTHTTNSDKRRIFELLRLRATLREDEHGQKLGRDHRFSIDLQTAMGTTGTGRMLKESYAGYSTLDFAESYPRTGMVAAEAG